MIVDQIITILGAAEPHDEAATRDAILNAAFIFEKARGLPPCAWPEEVVHYQVNSDEVGTLKRALVAFVGRTGIGSWALGKCLDPELKPIFIAVLRSQLDGDIGELYQAMIALENLGEPVFQNATSSSVRDAEVNRRLAAEYLARLPG